MSCRLKVAATIYFDDMTSNRLRVMKILLCIPLLIALTACQYTKSVKLIFPEGGRPYTKWTEEERQKAIAVKPIYRSTESSAFLIRLKGNELPHYHDHHDLSVSLLSGKSIIHFKDHEHTMMPGDVVFVPQGTLHWAENIDPAESIVFAVFSPAYSGKDKRLAD